MIKRIIKSVRNPTKLPFLLVDRKTQGVGNMPNLDKSKK